MLNKRYKIQITFLRYLLLVWLWFPGPLLSFANADNINPTGIEAVRVPNDATGVRQPRFMVAENERNAEDKNGSDSSAGGDTKQKPDRDRENKPSNQKNDAGSVKPFEPTEKVKADQAVDFPYDI